jgi:hypothetical protein
MSAKAGGSSGTNREKQASEQACKRHDDAGPGISDARVSKTAAERGISPVRFQDAAPED